MTDIYATLFERIVYGQYKPKSRLKEEELAEQFQVSRTPVREALKLLEYDGLIEISPKKGAQVIGLSVDDVEEIYEIRKPLELLALQSSITVLNIQGLLEIRQRIQEVNQIADFKAHQEVDARLHSYIIEASGKRRLVTILNQLFRLVQRFRETGFKDHVLRESAYQDHMALIDAVCLRDLDLATELLGNHIDKSKVHSISLLVRGNKG